MTTPEAKVKNKVKKFLDSYEGISWFMPQAGIYGRKGVGDFVCCVNGQYVEIETKAKGNKLSPTQKLRQNNVYDVQGHYIIVRDGDTEQSCFGLLEKIIAAAGCVKKGTLAIPVPKKESKTTRKPIIPRLRGKI